MHMLFMNAPPSYVSRSCSSMWRVIDVEPNGAEAYNDNRHADRLPSAKSQYQTKLMLGIIIILLLITVSMQVSQFTSSMLYPSAEPHLRHAPQHHISAFDDAELIRTNPETNIHSSLSPPHPAPSHLPPLHPHHPPSPAPTGTADDGGGGVADDCYHVYVDVGSSTGIQIRKLFEARLFPGGAPYAMAKFDHYFGPWPERVSSVCAFAFEPNPHHEKRLQTLASSYKDSIGARMKAYTRTAAGVMNGVATFITDGDTWNDEWGATITDLKAQSPAPASNTEDRKHNKRNSTSESNTVQLLDLGEWMTQNIVNRRLSAKDLASAEKNHTARKPAVVMKIDIEGRDTELIAHLMRTGVLCHVNYLYVEHLEEEMAQILTKAMQFQGCPTIIEYLDDEQCHRCKYPLLSAPEYPEFLEKISKARNLDELGWPVDE